MTVALKPLPLIAVCTLFSLLLSCGGDIQVIAKDTGADVNTTEDGATTEDGVTTGDSISAEDSATTGDSTTTEDGTTTGDSATTEDGATTGDSATTDSIDGSAPPTDCDSSADCPTPAFCREVACIDGQCVEAAVVCDDGNDCTEGFCDGDNGECVFSPTPLEGTACEDADPCTSESSCTAGQCLGESDLCSCSDDTDCTEFNDLCTGAYFCVPDETGLKTCTLDATTVVDCPQDPDNPCQINTCNKGACELVAQSGVACDDNNACTNGDLCDLNGVCVGPQPVVCPSDGDPCTVDQCIPAVGACVNTPAGPSTACDDGNPCTINTFCQPQQGCVGEPAQPLSDCGDGNLAFCIDANCLTRQEFTQHPSTCTDSAPECTQADTQLLGIHLSAGTLYSAHTARDPGGSADCSSSLILSYTQACQIDSAGSGSPVGQREYKSGRGMTALDIYGENLLWGSIEPLDEDTDYDTSIQAALYANTVPGYAMTILASDTVSTFGGVYTLVAGALPPTGSGASSQPRLEFCALETLTDVWSCETKFGGFGAIKGVRLYTSVQQLGGELGPSILEVGGFWMVGQQDSDDPDGGSWLQIKVTTKPQDGVSNAASVYSTFKAVPEIEGMTGMNEQGALVYGAGGVLVACDWEVTGAPVCLPLVSALPNQANIDFLDGAHTASGTYLLGTQLSGGAGIATKTVTLSHLPADTALSQTSDSAYWHHRVLSSQVIKASGSFSPTQLSVQNGEVVIGGTVTEGLVEFTQLLQFWHYKLP